MMRPKTTGRAGKTSSRRSTICVSPPAATRVSFWSAEVHFELVPGTSPNWTRSTRIVGAMLLSLRLKYADERYRVAARLGSVDSVAGHARPDRRVGADRCA